MSMLEKFLSLADKLEADAAGIRRRANSGASSASQRLMHSEAATLERSARAIRAQIDAALAEDEADYRAHDSVEEHHAHA